MRLFDFMSYGNIEISNANRTGDYLRNIGLGIPATFTNCGCDATDFGPYNTPASDPAPWFDPTRAESGEFLGIIAHNVRLDAVIKRAVTPKTSFGASIGPLSKPPRIVSVQAIMVATTEQGMSYGTRWLNDVLSGVLTGCAQDTLRLLLACPSDGGTTQFRTLRRVGIVDGPTTGPANNLPECHVCSVTFQLAAGIPQLLSDPVDCIDVLLSSLGS